MAENRVINIDKLADCDWRELRTELVEWDDGFDAITGFDGLTRYWCSEAVFEVYWTAEHQGSNEYKIYLTEDLELAEFNAKLDFNPSLAIKQKLASAIGWQKSAQTALKKFQANSRII